MPENARSYLRPGAVERIFGASSLFSFDRPVRGHFYVLEVRGRQTADDLAAGGPDRARRAVLSRLRARQRQLGAQCPRGRRSRARPRAAPPTLCRA
jgi:hypothetical protein